MLHNYLLNFPQQQFKVKSNSDEWSLKEILCHLRDVDIEVNIPRLQAIIIEENPTLTGVSTDQWAVERNYSGQDALAAFTSFVEARKKLVSLFASLKASDWSRRANHTFLGPTTLSELAGIMLEHDQQHIFQVHETLK